jgi:hypothetical protein
MINPLIHYELEMATRQQDQLRRRAALWHVARQSAAHGGRPPRPHMLRIGLAVVALVLGSATSATLAAHW